MSTTVGETGADYLAVHVGLGTTLTDAIMGLLLVQRWSFTCARGATCRGPTG
jgi:uncharacterized membrane-anchored protein